MLEHWILPLAIVVAVAVLLLAPALEALQPTHRVERRFCPHIRYPVEVEYLERGGFGIARPVDVVRCIVVDDEPITVILCARPCLERAGRDWLPALPRAA